MFNVYIYMFKYFTNDIHNITTVPTLFHDTKNGICIMFLEKLCLKMQSRYI